VTLWIDPPAWPAHGRLWSHLISDTSLVELHIFAAEAGLPRRACEGDHYDVPQERYAAVVAAGARPVAGRDLVRILQRSGLRIPKRRHERVLVSRSDAPGMPAGGKVDVILSGQASPPVGTVEVRLLATADREFAVVRREDGGLDLPSRAVTGGSEAAEEVRRLQFSLLGAVLPSALVGYVRNTVPGHAVGYHWPVPRAAFPIFHCQAELARPPRPDGRDGVHWLRQGSAERHLAGREWWPLVADLLRRDETAPG
jgi:hypothetical protein